MDIWKSIDELKKEQDLTDAEIGRRLGKVSPSYIYNLRSGLSRPRPPIAERLANLLVEGGKLAPEQKRDVILQLLGIAA